MKIERVMTGLSLEDMCELMCGGVEYDEDGELEATESQESEEIRQQKADC